VSVSERDAPFRACDGQLSPRLGNTHVHTHSYAAFDFPNTVCRQKRDPLSKHSQWRRAPRGVEETSPSDRIATHRGTKAEKKM